MICPKCKTKVSKEDTHCPSCNLRLIFECPKCQTPARLGSVSCKNCGHTFVKFCPNCKNANHTSISICRKCGHPLDEPTTDKNEPIIPRYNTLQSISENAEEKESFLIYIDFINLDSTFEKYNTEEFKQKVTNSIKQIVKEAFGVTCNFMNSHTVVFEFAYTKTTKILNNVSRFEEEFNKFNKILENTLHADLPYKFAISTIEEVRKNKEIPQLKHGSDKDIIVSSKAYSKLTNELSLIKISQDSYKMIYLEQKTVFEQTENKKYDKAFDLIFKNLIDVNSQVRAISVNSPRGVGKTHLFNDIFYKVTKTLPDNTVILYAQCSALTQVSPFGLIQNLFIGLLGCSTILKDDFNPKAFKKRVLDKLNLDDIDERNLDTLANLIYPIRKDFFENILINKEITYKYLKDVFDYIKKRKHIVLMIDDFDIIDESSYAFLKYLINHNFFEHGAKLVLGYKNEHSLSIYFQSTKFNNANSLNISLRQFNIQESKSFIKKILGTNSEVADDILSQIAYNAQGNIAYIEQLLQYLFERKILIFQNGIVKLRTSVEDVKLPETLEECIQERLDFLKEHNLREYLFLTTTSLLGDKLENFVLGNIFELSENEFFELVTTLDKKGYLKRKIDDVYGFKNSLTWSYCYIRAKEEPLIKEYAKKLLMNLNKKVISTPLICPILAQIIGNKELAYSLWTKNLQYANYIGDSNIYAMAQKQCLILLENVKVDNFDYTKNNICERLGKLIYDKNPQEAKDYLINAILAAQKNNDISKIIDLSGYLVKAVYLIQDYTGVVEIIDNILKYFDKADSIQKKATTELQIALIKTRKLEALLKLGSWEEIASIVDTEINPVLQKNTKFFARHKWISQEEIFYSWIESNIIAAQSYAQQGSPLAFELIRDIEKILTKEKNIQTDSLKVRLAYAKAMAHTSRGSFAESDNVLQDILKNYSYIIDSPMLVSEWNVINIINKILRSDYHKIKDDLFEATAYANNCNDEVSKNILKTLLAYVLLQEKSFLKAVEIAKDEMEYFSHKKIAFGALLAWYVSAAATSNNKTDNYCIDICQKSIKICENAKNNNYFFKILFQELLAETYLKINDLENAKMYCDLANQTAVTNELLYLQVRLQSLKTQIARECLSMQASNKKYEYAQNVIKMYNRTLDFARKMGLENHAKKIQKDLTSFKAHCQLNRIIED